MTLCFFFIRLGGFSGEELDWKQLLVLSCTVLEKVYVVHAYRWSISAKNCNCRISVHLYIS